MRKRKKRIFSIFAAVAMLAALMPVIPASAAASINIGEYIEMGTYYGEPILWRCVDIDQNGPLMLSDKIICLKPFDAYGSNTSGSHGRSYDSGHYRKQYGSNYWADSNMRSWLNSSASAGNVQWLCGNPPDNDHVWYGYNDYADEAGFKTNFTSRELGAVKTVTQDSLLNYNEYSDMSPYGSTYHTYDYSINNVVQNANTSAYRERVTDEFFLLDVNQINAVYNNRFMLGDDYYIGRLTEGAVKNSEYFLDDSRIGNKWIYGLRSPDAYDDYGYGVRLVDLDGLVEGSSAYEGGLGVRPAFYLNLLSSSFSFGNGTLAAPYKVYGTGGGASNSTSDGAPILTAAKVGSTDIFTTVMSVQKGSSESYDVSGKVDANGCTDVHLYMTQDAKSTVEIPLNASKSIQIGKEFSPGQPVYMTAVDKKTGKSSSKRTKLSVVGDGMFDGKLSDGTINIIDDFFVDIPEDVPVIEKQKIGFSLGSVSSEVEISGNEFKVSLGSDFLKGKRGTDGKWKKEDWEGFKSGFKSAKESMRHNAGAYKYLKNIAPKSTKMEMSKGMGGSADVSGYIEGYIDDSGIHPTEGGIIIHGELKYKYQGMTLVAVVPVYYEIGAGGELTFVGGVKDLVPGSGLQGAWTGSVMPAAFFEIGGGVGIPVIFTVGISGKVKAELEIALNKIYQKLDITGTASFKLTGPFGVPTYNKPFASGIFHVYETGNYNTLLGRTLGLASEESKNVYDLIDIDAPVMVTPHSDSTQEWVGDEIQLDIMAVDYTNRDVKVLEHNSYESIAPILAEMDGKNVIAWITDNKERTDGDKSMLVYSVENDGVWSAPQPVYDDGLADSTPVMKDGYVVWQKAEANITSDLTARDLGAACEVYMAKWNGSSFDEAIRVTDNALLDQTPLLAVNNGSAAAVWVQNSDNNFMGTTGENRIMSYADGTTKTEAVVSEAITNISAAYIDGVLNIAYEIDRDNDLSTLTDREIYSTANGTVSRITNNSLVDTHPVYSDLEGQTVLLYYSDGKIVYLKDGAENTVIDSGVATDQFTAVSNGNTAAVLWTAVNDGSAEIHGALYDGNEWSEDVQVSDLGTRIKFPSAVMKEDGSIFAAFNRTQKVPTEYYYDDGQADLCTIKIIPSYDIEIADAYFDESSMTAYATVKNSGELEIPSYTAAFDGNNSITVTEPLKAGGSAEIELAYNKPENLSPTKIELALSIDGDEYDTDNNKTVFEIGHADIIVENVSLNETETAVSADVSNIGYADAPNVAVSLRDGSAEGAVIETKTVSLDKDAYHSIGFDVDKEKLHFMDGAKPLYITASIDEDEISLGNNDGYVLIASASGNADYEIEILGHNKTDDKYVINSFAGNNTGDDVSCVLYTAVYSPDGKLKGCGCLNAEIGAGSDTGVDIAVDCDIEPEDVIKTFMWDKNGKPLAKAAEYTAR